MGKPAVFSIIGGAGFRAQYYLRIAKALPDRFRVSAMTVRDEAKGREMEKRWQVPAYRTMEQMLEKDRPDFVVVSVSGSAQPGYLLQLAELGIPALAETPPAPNLEGLIELHEKLTLPGARIQVAEQYQFHPLNEARMAVIRDGRLGEITQATVSISHLYHGVSLLRKMLGIGFEDVAIRGMRFESDWLAGPNRSGPPKEEKIATSRRDLAWLDFGNKLGIYDFTSDQHRSWIRSNHLSVRGVRGEIFDRRLSLLHDYKTARPLEFRRINKGEWENAEGYFLQGIMAGDQWVYENPFMPGRLYDDEIAIASCLQKMAAYAAGGPDFYGLPEASQDCYLGYLIEQAIQTGENVPSVRQPWAPK
ncbi:Gfo/Idh/MocA family oxidoreductase [Paenibacillus sp. MWE-103]|uniref:Gfo/Idh/MocA family oxidoreductase n=1 Tax=Paenibacillus artemisiicola TaxID=1172618 RepID=A0ABS3W5S7_9BACL|nr:Gfo/Idh/MocA family oxidoreductase [Paenibacillus artemisiicola]MBO7743672.1 Gfo/Idh/MocA family oxidoreductase [Paenibacillus artemisiicola]